MHTQNKRAGETTRRRFEEILIFFISLVVLFRGMRGEALQLIQSNVFWPLTTPDHTGQGASLSMYS